MTAGRKQKWDELNMENRMDEIEKWASEGLMDKDIMHRLGISHELFYKWKRERLEFHDALKRGKQVVDEKVENSLLQRALGYEYEEVKTFIEEIGDKKKKKVEKIKKVALPDITAQIFWLKNRKPSTWRDKQNIEHTGKDGNAIETKHSQEIDLSNLSDEELNQLEQLIIKAESEKDSSSETTS